MKCIEKHRWAWLSILAAALLCSACTSNLPAVQNITQNTTEQPMTTPQSVEIIISHSQNIGTPEDLAAVAMQNKLQEVLGDAAEVILYADYQLGSAREQLEAMQLGRIHITIQSVSYVSQFVDDLKVLTLPYLFPADAQAVMDVLDGPLETELLERIGMEGNAPVFKGLGLWFGGEKLFTFHGDDHKHIQSPADFCGLSIAVPDTPVLKAQYQHWGAVPVETDAIALYSTLAQRVADGSEVTAQQIATNYLYEVQHNIVQAHHSTELYAVLTNAPWFDRLSPDVQNAIIEAEAYGKEQFYKALAEQEPMYMDTICQAEGVRYEILDEKEIAIFKTMAEPIYTEQLSGSQWQIDYVRRLRQCFT